MNGWIAMHRGEEAEMLQERHPTAFLLLCQIARRARWKSEVCPITGLSFGQAMIGDWKAAGLKSEKAYRHAMGALKRAGIVAFQGANRGTIATLVSTTIFTINPDATGEQRGEQRGGVKGERRGDRRGELGATKNKEKTERREQIDALPLPPALDTPRFAECWDQWKRHRAEIRKALTPSSAACQLALFADWGEARAIAAITHTIAQGWQGIREPEASASARGTANNKTEGTGALI